MLKYVHMLSKNTFKYWHLIREIAVTDFKLKYQGSALGYIWSLMKPLALFGVLYIVFVKVFKFGGSIPHYPVYLLLGVMIFNFWGESTTAAMLSIASKGDLIRKVYFPRIILVLSATFTSLITFSLNMVAVFLFAWANGVNFSWSLFLVIPFILLLYIFVLGTAFYLGAFFVKFRDIGHIWEVFNQMLFYLTPILYPIASVPSQYAKYMILSPIAEIIQAVRWAFIGEGVVTIGDYWHFIYVPTIFSIFIFITGYYVFQKMAAKFAEEV